jgi:hypothetical protein
VNNPYLIHIDAVTDGEDERPQFWQRFISTDLFRAASFLKDDSLVFCRVNVQETHRPDRTHEIYEVTHVTEGLDRNWLRYVAFYALSGKLFAHIPNGAAPRLEDSRGRIWTSLPVRGAATGINISRMLEKIYIAIDWPHRHSDTKCAFELVDPQPCAQRNYTTACV